MEIIIVGSIINFISIVTICTFISMMFLSKIVIKYNPNMSVLNFISLAIISGLLLSNALEIILPPILKWINI